MAKTEQRNINILVTAKDQASKVLKDLGNKLSDNSLVGGAVGGAVGGVTAAVTSSLIDGATGVVTSAWNDFKDKELGGVQAEIQLGKTPEQVKELQDSLSDVYKKGFADWPTINTTLDEIDGKFGEGIKSNKDYADSIKFLVANEKLFLTPIGEGATAVGTGVRVFHEDLKTSAELYAQAEKLIGDDFGDLEGTISSAGSAGDRLNLSLETFYNGFIEFTKRGGTNIDIIPKALNNAIGFLDTGGDKAGEFFHTINQVLKTPNRNFSEEWAKGSKEAKNKILQDIGGAIEKIKEQDPIKANELSGMIFGTGVVEKQGDAFLAFLSNQNDYLDANGKLADTMVKKYGELSSVQLEGVINQFKDVAMQTLFTTENMERFKDIIINDGPKVLSFFEGMLKLVGKIGDWIDKFSEGKDRLKEITKEREDKQGIFGKVLNYTPMGFAANKTSDFLAGTLGMEGGTVGSELLSKGGDLFTTLDQKIVDANNKTLSPMGGIYNINFNGNNIVDKKAIYDFAKQTWDAVGKLTQN